MSQQEGTWGGSLPGKRTVQKNKRSSLARGGEIQRAYCRYRLGVAKRRKVPKVTTWGNYYPRPILVHWMGSVYYGTPRGTTYSNNFGSQGGNGRTNTR